MPLVNDQLGVLFHPRTREWANHSEIREDRVFGPTAISVGRRHC